MTGFIQRLIEKQEENAYMKPRYRIKQLYVGAIVRLTDRNPVGFGVWETSYEKVKDFAIFYKRNDYDYIHIKSGQKLSIIDGAMVGDYCIVGLETFAKTYSVQMREMGDTENTKYSKCFVDNLETAQNIEWGA